MKTKSISLILLLGVIVVVTGVLLLKNYDGETLVEVKWNKSEDALLAITIDGKESDGFPSTSNYTGTVTCSNGNGTATWNGSKWVFNVTGISKNKTRCNVEFESLPTWENPGTGTLLAAIKRDNENASTNTFGSAEDDYGTSYYFKKVVSNNYVEYANMCWRIVRVVGNGAIKIILHNYNGLTDSNMTPSSSTPCNVTADDLAFARYEGDTYMTSFNTSSDDNAYVGFMYGTVGANNFTATHLNKNPSTILSNLNKWYINVFSKQAGYNGNQLADTIWCNDKTATSYGYGQNDTTYLTNHRLTVSDDHPTAVPTFKCSNDPSGGRLSIFTFEDTTIGNRALRNYSKLGLLTADEAVLAGTPYLGSYIFPSLYLGENTKSWWWLMSPYSFSSGSAYNYGILGGHPNEVYNRMSGSKVTTSGGLRPALSLVSKIKISTGDGTNTNPYKVVMN